MEIIFDFPQLVLMRVYWWLFDCFIYFILLIFSVQESRQNRADEIKKPGMLCYLLCVVCVVMCLNTMCDVVCVILWQFLLSAVYWTALIVHGVSPLAYCRLSCIHLKIFSSPTHHIIPHLHVSCHLIQYHHITCHLITPHLISCHLLTSPMYVRTTDRAVHRASTMGGSASGIGSAFPYNWTKTDFTKTDSRSAAKPLRSKFHK